MEFRTTILTLERNGLGVVLGPLLVLRRFIHSLVAALQTMIWRELIDDEAPESQLVHLLAFLLFSALCLWSSLEGTVPYVIGLLVFMLPLELVATHLGVSSQVERQILLQRWGNRITWRSDSRQGSERLDLERSAIAAVVIRGARVPLPQEGERWLGWDVLLAVADPRGDHLLARTTRLTAAWHQAHALAGDLGVPFRMAPARAPEASPFPPGPRPEGDRQGVWRVTSDAETTRLFRDRRTVKAVQWWRSFAREHGYLLFLAVLYAVMPLYGGFLAWMFGPPLGLGEPTTLVIDLSPSGLLSRALPMWDGFQVLLAGAVISAAGLSSHRQWLRQEITLNRSQVTYRRRGQAAQILPTRLISEPILLQDPLPQLILWSERRPPIVVPCLSEREEGIELIGKLQAALDRWRPVPSPEEG